MFRIIYITALVIILWFGTEKNISAYSIDSVATFIKKQTDAGAPGPLYPFDYTEMANKHPQWTGASDGRGRLRHDRLKTHSCGDVFFVFVSAKSEPPCPG